MAFANQMRDLVSQYLCDGVDLESFSNRFVSMFDDIEDTGDSEAIRLSYEIESLLADISAGIATEADLRAALVPCLTVVEIAPEYQAKGVFFTKQASSGVCQFEQLEVSLT